MTDAQGWTLLAMVGVLLGVIGGLIVHQFTLLRGYLDARFEGVDARFEGVDARFAGLERSIDSRFAGLERSIDVRFRSVNERLDTLDRDVHTLIRDRLQRDRADPRAAGRGSTAQSS